MVASSPQRKDDTGMSIGDNKSLPILGESRAPLTRREMALRLLAAMSAGTLWPVVGESHAILEYLNDFILDDADSLDDANWKPAFLNIRQNETLTALAEVIVPGSSKAQVNRFLDLLFSVDKPEMQHLLVESLAAFDGEARERFEKDFPSLDDDQKRTLLMEASKNPSSDSGQKPQTQETRSLHKHFENLKTWISMAYYSSEAGLRELGWTGNYAFEKFPGCDHPEGHR